MDGYNCISWDDSKIKVPVTLPQGTEIELHVVPDEVQIEVRLWYKGQVIKVIRYKN